MSNFDERFLDVDNHGVLKISLELWLCMIISIRYWLFVLVGLIYKDLAANIGTDIFDTAFWLVLGCEVCGAFLLYSGFSREPSAGIFTRAAWKRGSLLLTIAATAHLGYMAIRLVQNKYWNIWPELFLTSFGIFDLIVLYVAWQSPHFKQIFNEFPNRPRT